MQFIATYYDKTSPEKFVKYIFAAADLDEAAKKAIEKETRTRSFYDVHKYYI